MKAKLIIILLALLLLSSVASAQSYSIRVTFNTNLKICRKSSSQHYRNGSFWHYTERGQRIEQMVSDRQKRERSLDGGLGRPHACREQLPDTDINAGNEQYRQLLFCGSAMQYRPENGRTVIGHFRTSQCTAPAGSQTQTSTQSTSTVSSQLDNCCFVDRQCASDQEWTDGYWAFQNNQCGAPAQTQTQTQTSAQPVIS